MAMVFVAAGTTIRGTLPKMNRLPTHDLGDKKYQSKAGDQLSGRAHRAPRTGNRLFFSGTRPILSKERLAAKTVAVNGLGNINQGDLIIDFGTSGADCVGGFLLRSKDKAPKGVFQEFVGMVRGGS